MQKINFQNLPSTTTPINATNLNAIQTNVENVFNGSEAMGNIVVTGIRTKNIFDGIMINGTIDTTNGNIDSTYSDYSIASVNLIPVKPNTTYTISFSGGNYVIDRLATFNSSGAFISRSNSLGVRTFTTDANTYYIRFNIWSSGITPSSIGNAQLEEGSTATTYTPYQPIGTNTDSGWISLNSYIKYRKVNSIVYVVCDNNGFETIPADSSYHTIGTLPANYRPSVVIPFASHVYAVATKSIIGRVETNGIISIYTNVSIDYFGFFVAFPV